MWLCLHCTSTTLDLILTTVPDKHKFSGVIESGHSDHYFVYTILAKNLEKTPPKTIISRDYKHFNERKFKEDLATTVEGIAGSHDTVDDDWYALKSKIDEISNIHAPL